MNLDAVRDEIKAAAQSCDGTPTAKLVAVLAAAGITDTKELAAILNVGERAIQKARKANSGSPNSETRTTVRNEPQDANHSSEPNQSSPGNEPQFAEKPRVHARIETPSGLVLTSVGSEESPPTPSNVKPMPDWRSAFGADDHGVEFIGGKLSLVNGTRSAWLERFDGDDETLDLALIEAAGSIQRNSNASLKLQVERKLANILRDKKDRDKRYRSAVAANARKPEKMATARWVR
jgi:hypothetical protein